MSPWYLQIIHWLSNEIRINLLTLVYKTLHNLLPTLTPTLLPCLSLSLSSLFLIIMSIHCLSFSLRTLLSNLQMTAPSYSSGLGVHITYSKRTSMITIYTGTILTSLNFSITLYLFCRKIIYDLKGSIYVSIYLVFCFPHHCFLNCNKNFLRTVI